MYAILWCYILADGTQDSPIKLQDVLPAYQCAVADEPCTLALADTQYVGLPTVSSELFTTLPDYLPPRPDILFVGINPGTYSAQQGHYYARSTNRFWWALHASGLVPEPLSPREDWRVVEFGLGLTDLVKRPTGSSAEVRHREFVDGRQALAAKIRQITPLIICFNGLTGYQHFFREHTGAGRQLRRYEGASVFVVPSTSARNVAYSREVVLAHFRELKALRDELRRLRGCREGA